MIGSLHHQLGDRTGCLDVLECSDSAGIVIVRPGHDGRVKLQIAFLIGTSAVAHRRVQRADLGDVGCLNRCIDGPSAFLHHIPGFCGELLLDMRVGFTSDDKRAVDPVPADDAGDSRFSDQGQADTQPGRAGQEGSPAELF